MCQSAELFPEVPSENLCVFSSSDVHLKSSLQARSTDQQSKGCAGLFKFEEQ